MRFAVIVALLLFSGFCHAENLTSLAHKPRWLALLHYNMGATLRDRHRSYVHDRKFFLAPNGATDPVAELRASVAALRPSDSKARCRFPARYRFVAEHLGWHHPHPFSHCTAYLKWRHQVRATRAVLVFPSSYLNSPSSMFGHTLLRLDRGHDGSDWLSWAVSFGAITGKNDNSFAYVYRGIGGGYIGRFTIEPYAKTIQEYSHMENRDIWEYTLNLTPSQVNWIIDNVWELRGINFNYYFFDENCSFRLLELINVALPNSGLLRGLRFTELPVNAVRALKRRGLITAVHFRPSRSEQLHQYSSMLSSEEKEVALRLAKNPALAQSPSFKQRPLERQALIVQTAYRYIRFKHRKDPRTEVLAGRSYQLLREMSELPPPPSPPPIVKVPPDKGHGSQMLAVAGGRDAGDTFGELTYRLTYHDLLDNQRGFLPGAQIEGVDLTLRNTRSGPPDLETLRLIDIRSLSPRDDFDKPLSWYVNGGLEHAWAGRRRLVRYLEGGAGGSWLWGCLQPYALASLRLENNGDFATLVTPGAGADVGILYHDGRWQWRLDSVAHYFTNDFVRDRTSLAVQYALTREQGLRARVAREVWRGGGRNEFTLQWRWYFH